MVTRGRRCPFTAWCAAVSLQARRNTALCFVCIGVCDMSWRLRCRHELATAYARTTPSINEVRFTPCHTSRTTPSTVAPRTVRGPAPRTCGVLRRTIHVPRCIKTRRACAAARSCAMGRKAPRHGLFASISCNWHRLCIKPCHRINVDPARVQHKVLAAGQVRTTASPEFSHRLGSRDAVFYFRNSFSPHAIRRCTQPSTLRKPRS
jgi:hypothetical protein